MRQRTAIHVTPADRLRLEAVVVDRNSRQKHVWRAKVILAADDGLGTAAIGRRAGLSRPSVRRWRERFAQEGVASLLRDKSRKPGKAPLPTSTVDRVVELTLADPPGEAPHWVRTFKLSTDPAFVPKLRDVVGLYLHPPAHAIVLSVDEKSQIQALERTQPGLPMREGRCATATHDYGRHGTTTLFAALNVLDGTILGRCMQRHRHQEFIRFLNTVEASVPAGTLVHVILDNYAAHKHPKVRAWLARHPRWVFHFTPTSASWINAVETFFSALTRRRLRRGDFPSIVDLQAAINRYIAEHNDDPRPFTWTKSAKAILNKVNRNAAPAE